MWIVSTTMSIPVSYTHLVEILGCGMVDPHDLAACNIDPEVYTGYAFGLGVELSLIHISISKKCSRPR